MTLHRVALRIAVGDEDAKEHARDVGVEDRRALAERKAADRAGRVGADALEGEKRFFVGGQLAAVSGDRLARDRLQPLRADVVAERVPGVGHLLLGCGRERFERRVLVEPLGVLRQHAIDLRLLQHDLGDEDVVRIAGLSPRQIAPVAAVPRQQPVAKSAAIGRHRQRRRFGPASRLAGALCGHIMKSPSLIS